MKIVFHSNVERFIRSLQKPTIAKLLHMLDLLEVYGKHLGMPHVKFLENGIWELRVRGRQEVRILFAFVQERVVCLHGYIKKSQRMPRAELETAKQRLRNLTAI